MKALLPDPLTEVSDDYLLARYGSLPRPFVRFNFVASLDGSSQVAGLSGGLGSAGDQRIFGLLRRLADVILVGAGTVRAEGYEGSLLPPASITWRRQQGLSDQPVLAIVSHGLNLSPKDEVFIQSPVPVLVFTSHSIDQNLRDEFPENVELIQVPSVDGGCSPKHIVDSLISRKLLAIHAEGGPRILGQFIAGNQVDSLCLSFSPVLVGGHWPRISFGQIEAVRQMSLYSLSEEESMLFSEYRRPE